MHNTDLHSGNVLLTIPGIDQITQADFERYLGCPRKLPVANEDKSSVPPSPHLPRYFVESSPDRTELFERCLLLTSPSVKICDFGESLFWDIETKIPLESELHTPCVYAAPEIIFHDRITPGVDVWALAVMMHVLLSGGMPLFPSRQGLQSEVLCQMVLSLGKPPDRY